MVAINLIGKILNGKTRTLKMENGNQIITFQKHNDPLDSRSHWSLAMKLQSKLQN